MIELRGRPVKVGRVNSFGSIGVMEWECGKERGVGRGKLAAESKFLVILCRQIDGQGITV